MEEVTKYGGRSVLAQFGAVFLTNLSIIQLGMSVGIITLVNGSKPDGSYFAESLVLNNEQASWYGSMMFISQPFGCLLFGPFQDLFGRKCAIATVNLIFAASWGVLYLAATAEAMYIAAVFFGFGIGFVMVTPLYITEAVEPRLRSIFGSSVGISVGFGVLLIFLLAYFATWRQLALYFAVYSIVVTLATLLFLPESPIWLLSHGKEMKAVKSLRRLRGCVGKSAVSVELKSLSKYAVTPELDRKSSNISSLLESLKKFWKPNVREPFILMNILLTLCVFSQMVPLRPYLVVILEDMMKIPGKSNMVYIYCYALLGGIVNTVTVKWLGKRNTILCFLGVSAICFAFLGLHEEGCLQSISMDKKFPLALIFIITGVGITATVYTYLGELFPVECRGLASGILIAVNCLVSFLSTKTCLDFINTVGLPLTYFCYSAIITLGIIYLYFFLPDTENKSLQQIQFSLVSKKSKIIDPA